MATAVTVTYLEMAAEPALSVHPPINLKVSLIRAEAPTAGFYRYLYDAVGRPHAWIDRKALADEALLEAIRKPGVEVWVLYVAGVPGGYFEVDAGDPATVALKYFGLVPEFTGQGLGKWLLAEAIRACWVHKPRKVTVNTCTLDAPMALPLYQRMGFVPCRREERVIAVLGA